MPVLAPPGALTVQPPLLLLDAGVEVAPVPPAAVVPAVDVPVPAVVDAVPAVELEPPALVPAEPAGASLALVNVQYVPTHLAP